MATLATIKEKVRLLTGMPSVNQLPETRLTDYINTYMLYDMPYSSRLLNLKQTLSFYTAPYVSMYNATTEATHPLYNFNNRYISITGPVTVSQTPITLVTSEQMFARYYDYSSSREQVATGDRATTEFTFTLSSKPVLQWSVVISCQSIGALERRISIVLRDNPYTVDGSVQTVGVFIVPEDPATHYGTINYITGECTIRFADPPGQFPIFAEYIPYVPGKPIMMYLNNDQMSFRPVPDKTYQVNVTAHITPTAFDDNTDQPLLSQWWQLIAYGAAKKVLEDLRDFEGVQILMPEFERQEALAMQKKILENSEKKTLTIYETPAYCRQWPFDDYNTY